MPVKLLLDENLRDGAIWHALKLQQQSSPTPIDIVRVADDNGPPLGSPDDHLVRWAAERERVLVSKDAKTLERTTIDWITSGNRCPGLRLLRKGIAIPELVAWLQVIGNSSNASDWENYSDWIP